MVDSFGVKVVAASEPAVRLENAVNVALPLPQTAPAPSWDDAGLRTLATEFQGQLQSPIAFLMEGLTCRKNKY
jgi:hypothetical protein